MSACTGCGTEIGGPPSGLCFACWGEKILLDTRLRDKECADYRTITRQRDALLAGCKAASPHLHELALEHGDDALSEVAKRVDAALAEVEGKP